MVKSKRRRGPEADWKGVTRMVELALAWASGALAECRPGYLRAGGGQQM